ncbi:MAG: SPW repeat domain-containing protein [Geodermatophilaceae bacterium]
MLRDGPIPRFVHGILEYALGVLFIAAPFVFTFDSGAATGMSVAVGVLILILAAVSEGPVSLVNQLPVLLHVALIYLLSIFLIAAPFLLGFADEVPPRNFFIISGVLLLLVTIGTRFRRSEPAAGTGKQTRRSGEDEPRSPAPASTSSTPPAGPLPTTTGMPPTDTGMPPPATGPPAAGTGLLPPVPSQPQREQQPPIPPPSA